MNNLLNRRVALLEAQARTVHGTEELSDWSDADLQTLADIHQATPADRTVMLERVRRWQRGEPYTIIIDLRESNL